MTTPAFQLSRNRFGRLVFTASDGSTVDGVNPIRAFPVAAPDEGVALIGPDGHEVAWIERMADLATPMADLLREELAARDFMPRILRINSVSTFATPSTWDVETDRGPTTLVLRGEEDIRRLAQGTLLIADNHGVQFLVRDVAALDKHSRKLLDRFL